MLPGVSGLALSLVSPSGYPCLFWFLVMSQEDWGEKAWYPLQGKPGIGCSASTGHIPEPPVKGRSGERDPAMVSCRHLKALGCHVALAGSS